MRMKRIRLFTHTTVSLSTHPLNTCRLTPYLGYCEQHYNGLGRATVGLSYPCRIPKTWEYTEMELKPRVIRAVALIPPRPLLEESLCAENVL